jgi:hypothetical protein
MSGGRTTRSGLAQFDGAFWAADGGDEGGNGRFGDSEVQLHCAEEGADWLGVRVLAAEFDELAARGRRL